MERRGKEKGPFLKVFAQICLDPRAGIQVRVPAHRAVEAGHTSGNHGDGKAEDRTTKSEETRWEEGRKAKRKRQTGSLGTKQAQRSGDRWWGAKGGSHRKSALRMEGAE